MEKLSLFLNKLS